MDEKSVIVCSGDKKYRVPVSLDDGEISFDVENQQEVRLTWQAKRKMRQITTGVVYSPGEVDSHGDTITEEELEKAAYNALSKGLQVGVMHEPGTDGAGRVVESYVTKESFVTKDVSGKPQRVPKGSWILSVKWQDAVWKQIMRGKITGYSLQGWSRHEPAEKAERPMSQVPSDKVRWADILFGVTPAIREYPIEDQDDEVEDKMPDAGDMLDETRPVMLPAQRVVPHFPTAASMPPRHGANDAWLHGEEE